MVNKVAAVLGFRAFEVQWLLQRKIFAIAATDAANLKYRNSLRYAQKSYKSKLTQYISTLYSVINYHRSSFCLARNSCA